MLNKFGSSIAAQMYSLWVFLWFIGGDEHLSVAPIGNHGLFDFITLFLLILINCSLVISVNNLTEFDLFGRRVYVIFMRVHKNEIKQPHLLKSIIT